MPENELLIFLGRFHPLLVHLPIGFLIIAALIEISERFSFTKGLKIAVPFILLVGAISGVFSCVLGIMLEQSGDYDAETLGNHKIAGIATTAFAFGAYLISKKPVWITKLPKTIYPVFLGLMILGLSVTGHLGGNLTHGPDYLTAYSPFHKSSSELAEHPTPTSIEEVVIYQDLVRPILKDKCQSCHNASKKKGKLSLASIKDISKGGKHGKVITDGDTDQSEIMIRVRLDPEDEEFMPTNGKTPLTEDEVALLGYWIEKGNANYDTLLMATAPSEEVQEMAMTYLGLSGESSSEQSISLAPPAPEVLANLSQKGFGWRELVAESNAFDVVLQKNPADQEELTAQLKALQAFGSNILWLKLDHAGITDDMLSYLSDFPNLQKLRLAQNPITDGGIKYLQKLPKLESIVLFQTEVSKKGLEELLKIPQLKRVYIWDSKVLPDEIEALKEDYPGKEIISGVST